MAFWVLKMRQGDSMCVVLSVARTHGLHRYRFVFALFGHSDKKCLVLSRFYPNKKLYAAGRAQEGSVFYHDFIEGRWALVLFLWNVVVMSV